MLTEEQKIERKKKHEEEKAIRKEQRKKNTLKKCLEKKEKIRTKKILRLRAKGYTLESIAGIFHIKNRERVRQLIKKYQDESEFQDLYRRIAEFNNFVKRNGKVE